MKPTYILKYRKVGVVHSPKDLLRCCKVATEIRRILEGSACGGAGAPGVVDETLVLLCMNVNEISPSFTQARKARPLSGFSRVVTSIEIGGEDHPPWIGVLVTKSGRTLEMLESMLSKTDPTVALVQEQHLAKHQTSILDHCRLRAQGVAFGPVGRHRFRMSLAQAQLHFGVRRNFAAYVLISKT